MEFFGFKKGRWEAAYDLRAQKGPLREKWGNLWRQCGCRQSDGGRGECDHPCGRPRSRAREHRGGTRAARVLWAGKRVRRGGRNRPARLPCSARERASGGQRLRLWKPPGTSPRTPSFLRRRCLGRFCPLARLKSTAPWPGRMFGLSKKTTNLFSVDGLPYPRSVVGSPRRAQKMGAFARTPRFAGPVSPRASCAQRPSRRRRAG